MLSERVYRVSGSARRTISPSHLTCVQAQKWSRDSSQISSKSIFVKSWKMDQNLLDRGRRSWHNVQAANCQNNHPPTGMGAPVPHRSQLQVSHPDHGKVIPTDGTSLQKVSGQGLLCPRADFLRVACSRERG